MEEAELMIANGDFDRMSPDGALVDVFVKVETARIDTVTRRQEVKIERLCIYINIYI